MNEARDLAFTPRGRMRVKGKGEMEMYFVRSISEDAGAHAAHPGAAESGTPNAKEAGRSAASEAGDPGLRRGYGPPTVVRSRDLRILLAEDNSFNVMVAQNEIEHSMPGVKVDVAANGAEALELVKRNTYDVVLMDVQMPVMDGYQATRAIRALPSPKAAVPIVAFSANVMKAEVDRCMEAGMNTFVPKPFKREALLAAIGKVLAGEPTDPS